MRNLMSGLRLASALAVVALGAHADARPFLEYAVRHIPGARNVAAKAGVPMSLYVSDVAEIGRVQLGIPVWRALGGVCEIEAAGLRHVLSQDRTAVLLDGREAEEWASSSVPRTTGGCPWKITARAASW